MKKRFLITFAVTTIILIVILLFINNVVGYSTSTINISKASFDNIKEDEEVKLKEKPKIEDLPEGMRVNPRNELLFVVMGVDSEKVETSNGTRTDTIMLCKMNFTTGNIDILSIPRDTRVNLRGKKDKINHAHAYGGSKLALSTIEDFLGIHIDHYVKVDYRVVKAVVDAIGGVEIDVPMDMHYEDPTAKPPLKIHLDKGVQVLDGQKAHDFLRYRKGYVDGDIGRVKAQQYFIKELIKQMIQPSNIFKLPQIIKSYYDFVDTDIPMNIILRAISNAYKINIENLNTMTVPGEGRMIKQGRQNISYYIYDEEGVREIVDEYFLEYKKLN